MITHLSIQNFAIIDSWSVDFEQGESAVTGETGSGKSLFVDALSFLAGGRADKNWRREGKVLVVEGTFLPDTNREAIFAFLQELDIPVDESVIYVSRTLDERGTRAKVNDRMITVKNLRILSSYMVDIHAQNAQSVLKDPNNYLPFLDSFAGKEMDDLKTKLSAILKETKELKKKADALELSPEEAEREKDLLHYEVREISEVALEELDMEALNREYRLLTGAEERKSAVSQLMRSFSGDYDIRSFFREAAGRLAELSRSDGKVTPLKDLCWQLEAETEGLEKELERYYAGIDVNPERIVQLDQLFKKLQVLKRKYGPSVEEICAYLENAKKRLAELENLEEMRVDIAARLERSKDMLRDVCTQMSSLRRKCADILEKKMRCELTQMAIKKISFKVEIQRLTAVSSKGWDEVDFMISTNPGEPMKSVSQVASGGEMSRFMLAFKIILSSVQKLSTLVFDEIDTGISGRTAQVVAEKLNGLAMHFQVIVISHLPQIAALSDHHYVIYKDQTGERTKSYIKALNHEQRIQEQARLIGGVNITALTRKSAEEMLNQALRLKEERHGL